MSDTDSFIEEVTEEVRRDRLYGYLRKYGWIPALVIVAIVAGTGWNEYRKATARAEAEALGDALIAALGENEPEGRAQGLSTVEGSTPGNEAIVKMLLAAAQSNSDQVDEAVAGLNQIALNGDLPQIYRDIAAFKALLLQSETLSADDRRTQFGALAQAGNPLRLLAEEQLALIDVAEGETDAAIERLQAILQDAEVTQDLQDRASQLIVALGGTPEALLPVTQG
ncbi:MAG: hypothetical protein AB3N23_15050 [Paracoccaceae bacterium]